jgi:hypothetical protein
VLEARKSAESEQEMSNSCREVRRGYRHKARATGAADLRATVFGYSAPKAVVEQEKQLVLSVLRPMDLQNEVRRQCWYIGLADKTDFGSDGDDGLALRTLAALDGSAVQAPMGRRSK